MKLLLSLLAPLAAYAACDAGAAITEFGWLLAGTDAKLAEICANGETKAKTVADINKFITDCAGDYATQLQPIFEIVGQVLCSTGVNYPKVIGEEKYCLPSLIKMVPLAGIIAQPESILSLDVYAQLRDPGQLDIICRTETCHHEIAYIATEVLQNLGQDTSLVMSIVKAAGSACTTGGPDGTRCSVTDFYNADKSVNPALACKDHQLTPCARKVISVVGNLTDSNPSDFCVTAGTTPVAKVEAAKAVLMLGITRTFYLANKDAVDAAIKSDLGYSLPGVLPDNISLKETPVASGGIGIVITFMLTEDELSSLPIVELLKYAQAELAKERGLIIFPALDTFAGIDNKLISESARLESIKSIELSTSTATSNSTDDATGNAEAINTESAAASLGISAGVVLVAAAMAM